MWRLAQWAWGERKPRRVGSYNETSLRMVKDNDVIVDLEDPVLSQLIRRTIPMARMDGEPHEHTLVITSDPRKWPKETACLVVITHVDQIRVRREPRAVKVARLSVQSAMLRHRSPANTRLMVLARSTLDDLGEIFPFIVKDFGVSVVEPCSLLACFSPGYGGMPVHIRPLPVVCGDWSTEERGSETIGRVKRLLEGKFRFKELEDTDFQVSRDMCEDRRTKLRAADIYLHLRTYDGPAWGVRNALFCRLAVVTTDVGPVLGHEVLDWRTALASPELVADAICKTWDDRHRLVDPVTVDRAGFSQNLADAINSV